MPTGGPLAWLARQQQDVNEALRILAEVHEQPDRAGFRYQDYPAADMLARGKAGPGNIELIQLHHGRGNLPEREQLPLTRSQCCNRVAAILSTMSWDCSVKHLP